MPITDEAAVPGQAPRSATLRHSVAVLVGAALLFSVQPVIAAQLLPRFGGAAAVWVGCLLFFQATLLVGYGYAHLLAIALRPRVQAWVHVGLLVLAALLAWLFRDFAPAVGGEPLASLLLLLSARLGLPMVLLAGTSPLVQHWFGLEFRHPYRLYVASNLASIVALLGFPFVLEPFLDLSDLYLAWALGLLALAGLCALCRPAPDHEPRLAENAFRYEAGRWVPWLLLSATGSLILLATTNVLAHEIAPIPLVSLPPLALYLLSFAVAFAPGEWRTPPALVPALFAAVCLLLAVRLEWVELGLVEALLLYCGGLFLLCLAVHGELAARKPSAESLTEFYLATALGSVLGACGVNFLAPGLFEDYREFEVGLVAAIGVGWLLARRGSRATAFATAAVLGVFGAVALAVPEREEEVGARLFAGRTFYGSYEVRVRGADTPAEHHVLVNDGITHGLQLTQARYQPVPTTYFGVRSGVGRVLLPEAPAGGRRVGVVGLGAGTLATYGREGDHYDFFEINPVMEFIAKRFFSFVRNARAEVRIVLGDARQSLEAQLDAAEPRYDVLVLDAFNGGAIPSHLLTEEAWRLYWRRLEDDGVLALHVSNRHVDLLPVVSHLNAVDPHGTLAIVNTGDEPSWGVIGASWIIVTRDEGLLGDADFRAASTAAPRVEPVRWTDERAPVTPLLAW